MEQNFIVMPHCLWDGIAQEAVCGTGVLIESGKVKMIGSCEALQAQNPSAVVYQNEDWLLLPSFVNAHDHGRGMSPVSFGTPDRALELWLQDLNKLPAIPHYDACYYDGLRLASCGVGTVLHSHNPNDFGNIKQEVIAAAAGYKAAGIRSILCPLYLDQNKRIYYNRQEFIDGLPEPLKTTFAAGICDQIMSIDEYLTMIDEICEALKEDIAQNWVEIQLHPNGGQWCSDEALLAMKEYALAHGMHIHLHLLETQYQAEYAMRTWGKSFIQHYQEIGFLGEWVSFAHAVWLDEEDLQLIAASGARLVSNPSSNLRLRSGIFKMHRAVALDLYCGIGLDGCAFDDEQDYLREIRTAWLNNSTNGVDAEIDPIEILKMATVKGASIAAKALSAGVIQADKNADFVCLSIQNITYPYADEGLDLLALAVQRATRNSVALAVVNGTQVWAKNELFAEKQNQADASFCATIQALRAKNNGKRDNSMLLQHVHDFYATKK